MEGPPRAGASTTHMGRHGRCCTPCAGVRIAGRTTPPLTAHRGQVVTLLGDFFTNAYPNAPNNPGFYIRVGWNRIVKACSVHSPQLATCSLPDIETRQYGSLLTVEVFTFAGSTPAQLLLEYQPPIPTVDRANGCAGQEGAMTTGVQGEGHHHRMGQPLRYGSNARVLRRCRSAVGIVLPAGLQHFGLPTVAANGAPQPIAAGVGGEQWRQ